ncbi:MAG TPA: hypothetical protein PLK82_00945, partial [Bacteroidales bacterium]|nr:hypothetical protein [Bacteroidales bacterium]
MKKLLFLFAYLSLVFVASAQVGINSDNSTPDPSAMLDVKSNSRGFLPPRMTHAEIEAIASPVDGLIVYCTDCDPEGGGAFFGYLNGYWAALSVCVPPARPGTGNHQADNDEIIWSWTGVPGAAGYRWNTVNSYPTAIDMGTALSKAESGLSSNTTYTRYVWAYNVCGSSLPQVLTASTTSAPMSVSIVSSANPVCAGSQVTYTATVVNGGASPTYNWYVNGVMQDDHGAVHVMAPDSFFDIFLEVFNGSGFITGDHAVSNTIHQVVTSVLPLSASIVSSANPSCAGSQVTFTSIVVNGGTNPVYNWYVNGVMQDDHSPVHVMAPDSFFDIFLEIFASPGMGCISGSPAVSNTIHQTVNPVLPLSASIVSSANPSCAGSQVTFTSTVVNGGSNPVYNWYVNGVMQGDHGPVHVMAPDSFFDIFLEIFASPGMGCISGSPAVSTTIHQVVNPVLPLSASIVSSANPSCAGSQVTFTSTVVNGGTNPVYNWYVNGVMQDDHSPVHVMAPDSFFDIFLEIFASPGMGCISGSPAV